MKVTIVSPQKLLFNGESREIVLPGEDGELSVLDFHQACLYSLRQGQIKTLHARKDQDRRFFIKSGMALVSWGAVDILVEEY